MPCKKSWARATGNVWTVQASDSASSVFMTGHLSVMNWNSGVVTSTVYTEAQLNAGVPINLNSGHTYLMGVVAVPLGNGAVTVTGAFDVDGVPLKGVNCSVTKNDPLCLWRMRRL